jgi:hypothetical protein
MENSIFYIKKLLGYNTPTFLYWRDYAPFLDYAEEVAAIAYYHWFFLPEIEKI